MSSRKFKRRCDARRRPTTPLPDVAPDSSRSCHPRAVLMTRRLEVPEVVVIPPRSARTDAFSPIPHTFYETKSTRPPIDRRLRAATPPHKSSHSPPPGQPCMIASRPSVLPSGGAGAGAEGVASWPSSTSMWSADAAMGGGATDFVSASDVQGGLSEQTIAERRKRNREHAKRSRVRKKVLLDSLQDELRELQRENANLKSIVSERLSRSVADDVLRECCRKSGGGPQPPREGLATAAGGTTTASSSSAASPAATADPIGDDRRRRNGGGEELARPDFALITSLLTTGRRSFVLSDPRLPDNPIVYASDGFCELTGYDRDQILGRNCRFLQGPDTDPNAVNEIRDAIEEGSDCETCLLNYKSDGTPFWNRFFVAALRDSRNDVVNYVGVQCEVDSKDVASKEEEEEEEEGEED